jgi:hypothetical protein
MEIAGITRTDMKKIWLGKGRKMDISNSSVIYYFHVHKDAEHKL